MNYFFRFIIISLLLLVFSCDDNPVSVEEPPSQSKYSILFQGKVDDQFGLYSIVSDGTNLTKISDFYNSSLPKWSSNGEKIVFMKITNGNNEIFTMDLNGTNEVKIAEGRLFCVSPDGDKIAYVYFDTQERTWELCICDIDGTNKVQLTNSRYQKFGVFWSPLNSEIVFTENDNWDGTFINLHRININTKVIDTLATGYELPQVSDWSKDGNYILFGANHSEIFKIDLNTKSISQLTNAYLRDEFARFSNDGSKILFNTAREDISHVYMMNADGSNQHKVSKYNNGSAFPQWSPDGTSISYIASVDSVGKIVIANSFGEKTQLLVSNSNSSEYLFEWSTIKIE